MIVPTTPPWPRKLIPHEFSCQPKIRKFYSQNLIHVRYLVPPRSLSRKQIKTKLMLCKPLFIVHVRVKGLFKVILEYKSEVPQLQKWAWHMYNEIA